MEFKTVPEAGGTVSTSKPKRIVHNSKRIPSRSNRQNIKGSVSRELEINDNNNKDGTLQDPKKSFRELTENNNEIKPTENESSPPQIQSPSLTKKPVPVSTQPWKPPQIRPSTAPPVLSLSVSNVKSETITANNKKEVNDFLKASELSSTSYHPEIQGPSSTHQPAELVTPSLTSCLKGRDSKLGERKGKGKPLAGCAARLRPATVDNSIVTFSPETVNIERENKPRRARSHKNNRKPKFAHPCCGHFLPPNEEIVSFEGTVEDMNNSYTRYTQVWIHPSHRKSAETNLKWNIRKTRLEKLLEEVSQIHRAFNAFSDDMKTKCLKKEIIPRYVMILDIVLTDGETGQVESLTKTIESSIRVLQTILHDDYFDENGQPKQIPQVPPEGPGYLQDLGAIISALNKISANRPRQETCFLGMESAYAKLQFELLSLSLCPVETVLFRCLVSVIPFTLRRIKKLLQEAAEKPNSGFYIKWVNNSVLHRDYMAILKELGYSDENGAKDGLPCANKKTQVKEALTLNVRPFSADADLRGRSSERTYN